MVANVHKFQSVYYCSSCSICFGVNWKNNTGVLLNIAKEKEHLAITNLISIAVYLSKYFGSVSEQFS